MYHAGLICAIFAFFLWCLPGAIGMFLLSVGVGKIGEVLPGPVYGLLSGLNASTVGIIALAAVQVSYLTSCFSVACPHLSTILNSLLSLLPKPSPTLYLASWSSLVHVQDFVTQHYGTFRF